jgi:hypothetical protein
MLCPQIRRLTTEVIIIQGIIYGNKSCNDLLYVLILLLSRSRLCHYSVGGAWWHLGFYESF